MKIKITCGLLSLFSCMLPVYNLFGQSSAAARITVSVTVAESSLLPDFQTWFELYFEDTSPPNYQVTSSSDYDGDGQFDYIEYYAGTDPTDGMSRLKIASVQLSGDDAIITWNSIPNRNPLEAPGNRFYRIFRCGPDALSYLASSKATIESLDELILNPPGNSFSLTSLAGQIPSDGTKTSYIDINVRNKFPLFYRVFLSLPKPQTPNPN